MKFFCFIAVFSISSLCFAQKQTITFIKANGVKTSSKDSALLIRTIMEPEQGSNLYEFTEVFVSGEPLRIGKSLKADEILPDGNCTTFYPSGKKLSEVFYINGLEQAGTFYFANGTIFKVSHFISRSPDQGSLAINPNTIQELIVTCNDSTGKALVTNGKGYFIGYRPAMDTIPIIDKRFLARAAESAYDFWLDNDYEEGEMKNGIRDGVWKGNHGGIKYTEEYKKGKFISGESDNEGKHYQYISKVQQTEFPGGFKAFRDYLQAAVHYPANAQANNIQGKVSVSFVVLPDGSPGDIKILQSPNNDLSEETIRIIKLSPLWNPASVRGVSVRQPIITYVDFKMPKQ